MIRVLRVLAAGSWDTALEIGTVRGDAEARFRRRARLVTDHGMDLLLDLRRPTRLADGSGLLLEDGTMVRVVAEIEALLDITAFDDPTLTRIAWHLGQRHIPVQFLRHRLRVRAERQVADLLERLGCEATPISAPFDPEQGAYEFRHG